MNKLSLVTAALAVGALSLGGCAAYVGTDPDVAVAPAPVTAAPVVATPTGQIVAGSDFLGAVQVGQPYIVTDDNRRGHWQFDGSRVVFVPEGGGARLAGTYTVRNDLYCTNYPGAVVDRCYRVYRTSPNSYALWTLDNRRHAVVTVR